MASLETHLSALLDSYRDNNAEWYPYTAPSDGWFSAIVGGTYVQIEMGVSGGMYAGVCLRVCFGWKLRQTPSVGKTCQHTARIAVFKHFGQGKG